MIFKYRFSSEAPRGHRDKNFNYTHKGLAIISAIVVVVSTLSLSNVQTTLIIENKEG